MKKLFVIAAALFIGSTSFAADGPNQKVLDAFNKTFQNATDVSWHETEKQYEASFHDNNNIRVNVLYDDEGNMLKTIRYYSGNVLPIFIQARLAKKYDGKTVFGVTEISYENAITYYIILEDAKTWIHVQSDTFGNMFTEKKYKKG